MLNNVKAILTLVIITVIAGAALGYVYELTKVPIENQERITREKAYKELFPEATAFEEASVDIEDLNNRMNSSNYPNDTIDGILDAVGNDGSVMGKVITVTSHAGYGGDITIVMGIDSAGTLKDISILSISETAGLGMNADTDDFKSQFRNKNVAQFSYTKTGAVQEYEIDAISGATITTSAVTDAINAGLSCFAETN